MTTKLPADRPLPHQQEILERILADEATQPRHRRGWLVPAGAAASIVLIAGGVLIATTAGHDKAQQQPAPAAAASKDPSVAPSAKPKPQGLPDVQINLGPLTPAETNAAAAKCLADQDNPNHPTDLGHAIKVRSWIPGKVNTSVAFTSSPEGLRIGCEGTSKSMESAIVGGDPAAAKPYKVVLNPPDATHPAAPTEGNGRLMFIELDKTPDLLVQDGWYRVDNRVESMRQRWIIRGKPGPWYVANAVDGLVFLRSWDQSTALKLGETVRVETQVLGPNGQLLDAPGTQKGGGGLTPSPGTTRVDEGKVVVMGVPTLDFKN
jgi:hypothetical protein